MRSILLLSILFYFSIFVLSIPVKAETEFEMYLSDFYKKHEQARIILKGIETDLKEGSRAGICARQQKAANYGIEATESLIKAFKINGSDTELDNLKAGLDKWRELRDYC
tara:strand:- start:210 stop:539 length:330 start_codon:yes stop_codon:yes gene_type:complete